MTAGAGRAVLLGRPQDARAAWRPGPLVEVRRVPVDAERADVDADVAGHVRTVREHEHAAVVADRRDLGDRQHQRGRRGEVVDDQQSRRGPSPAATAST